MRLVFISDTHLRDTFAVPNGDVLVHCGDLTMMGSKAEIRAVNRWLGTLSHKHKVVIAGNHDWLFERAPRLARSLMSECVYLQDTSTTLEGVTFYGSPWTPWFYDWAFNVPRGSAMAKIWAKVPHGVDVLVTHGPPMDILDRAMDGESCGDEELLRVVTRIKPRIHAFGHIHESHGAKQLGDTLFVNACICNAAYAPTQAPIVVDLSGDEAIVHNYE